LPNFSPLLSSFRDTDEYRYDYDGDSDTFGPVCNYLCGLYITVFSQGNEEKLDFELTRFQCDLYLQAALFGLTPDTLLASDWFLGPERTKGFVSGILLAVRTLHDRSHGDSR
jgi:hypothetical protein